MRIAFITAGAAGMYCGSCMRDNALVRALQKLGHDALLLPTYTPIRTDEPNVSDPQVFYGGINVYLQEKSSLFRHTPRFIDKLFDWPAMLRWASRYAHRTKYDQLGGLTISMLQGRDGHQRKELDRLVEWLKEIQPDIVLITAVLLSGIVPELKRALGVPVLATLQGDDIFLEALHPADRQRCLELIRDNCRTLDGFIATSRFYADHMSEFLGVGRERIEAIPPGISLDGHGGPRLPRGDFRPAVGFFARIAPEKGFHNLVDAFVELRKTTKAPVLRASGWLGEQHKPYLEEQIKKLAAAGLAHDFEHIESPDLAAKSRFFRSIDVLSVPTVYREPKGLYVLEAWANGVPVVLPNHGCFSELVDGAGGGRLVPPGDPKALAAELGRLLHEPDLAAQLGATAKAAMAERYTAEAMAKATLSHLERFLAVPVGAER
jgi:glycosyltransferase involved in cell wall biosynthesis